MHSSNASNELFICGMGAATPVGRDAWSSAAAVRAGLTGFAQHSFMVDSEGKPMSVAVCAWLAQEPSILNRICHLLISSVRDALQPLLAMRAGKNSLNIVLLVGLPLNRPGLPSNLADLIQRVMEQNFPTLFSRIAVAQRGHASGFIALDSANKIIAGGSAQACIVAGVDSYLDPDTLEWLEETEQLHGAGPFNNAWGFIPGEGAGAVLLMSNSLFQTEKIVPFGKLLGLGLGQEKNLIRTGSVCLGEGLTAAFRNAFASQDSNQLISDIYCDMNGEPYRADEYGFTVTRTRERFIAASDFTAPADCWGDVGAASAPLFILLAVIAIKKDYAKGNCSLIFSGSDSGERGAAIITSAIEA